MWRDHTYLVELSIISSCVTLYLWQPLTGWDFSTQRNKHNMLVFFWMTSRSWDLNCRLAFFPPSATVFLWTCMVHCVTTSSLPPPLPLLWMLMTVYTLQTFFPEHYNLLHWTIASVLLEWARRDAIRSSQSLLLWMMQLHGPSAVTLEHIKSKSQHKMGHK